MIKNLKRIVIVGGGSAGWMTASMLIKFFPDHNISLIESPDHPTVGVGESTLLGIKNYANFLGIDEKDFMSKTDGSYKMSIKFTNFYEKKDGGFHYPFGYPLVDDTNRGIHDWFVKKALYPETPNNDFARYYFPSAALYEQNRFCSNEDNNFLGWSPKFHTSYHFDATKFGNWLRDNYSVPRGVKLIRATVVDQTVNDQGIDELILSDGQKITSDLFIDCTGFKSLLLGKTLGTKFNSLAHVLPNNRAWATRIQYKDKQKELEPFTNCTALGNGWVWNIPSWERLGTGYVYSDKFITPEDAKEEFKQHLMSNDMICPRTREEVDGLEFKDIPMRVGIHDQLFVKNVVAIGLSAGFIEPLESNGLFSVHSFLDKLVKILLSGSVSQFDRDCYNAACKGQFQNFVDFVAMHYAFSKRNDTEYWKANNDRIYDGEMVNLKHSHNGVGFFDYMNTKNFGKESLDIGLGLIWISTGMNHHLVDSIDVLNWQYEEDANFKEDFAEFFNDRHELIKKVWAEAKLQPTLYEYLKKNIYN